jgi:acetyltransferase-like isoleucine patch superfamily enzyme
MPWLIDRSIHPEGERTFSRWLGALAEKLADPSTDRYALVREELARLLYAQSFEELSERAPMSAFALDPHNILFEAERYIATDPTLFAPVKPLLWFWKTVDRTPLGQSIHAGPALRAVLAPWIFKRVGKNPRFFHNVEFSVGYNLEIGDEVTVHRGVLLDDIGGIILGDGCSISDYANIYSHTHSVLHSPDVTLKQTILGSGVRITYHATILAGVRIGDDALVGSGAVVTRDVPPHAIALGIPARVRRFKVRPDCPYCRAGIPHPSDLIERIPDRKANPEFPAFTPPETREA